MLYPYVSSHRTETGAEDLKTTCVYTIDIVAWIQYCIKVNTVLG